MSFVSELKTFEARAAAALVSTWKKIKFDVLPALQAVNAKAATIETVTGFINPAAEKLEVAAFALLGAAITAILAADAAGVAKGVNVSLDEEAIKDIKALIPAVKGLKS